MTYTDVNPHTCCNWPRPEDAHTAVRPPREPHALTHLTNNYGLIWKTDCRPSANGPPTAKNVIPIPEQIFFQYSPSPSMYPGT